MDCRIHSFLEKSKGLLNHGPQWCVILPLRTAVTFQQAWVQLSAYICLGTLFVHTVMAYINTQPLGTQVATTFPFLASVKLKVGPYLAIV